MIHSSQRNPWIAPIYRDKAPKLRLIAIPHAGGWPTAFLAWRKLMPIGVELLVTQFPGRGTLLNEEPITSIHDLVDGLIADLCPLLNLPYILLGHSFGSIVCYELVRRLRLYRLPLPEKLVVSARQAPHIPTEPPFIHQMADVQLITYLDRIGGLPPLVAQQDDILYLVLRAVRADFQALETYMYKPETPFNVPITLAYALDDPIVSPEPLSLWREYTSSNFETERMWGGHFYIYRQENAEKLIKNIFGLSPGHC